MDRYEELIFNTQDSRLSLEPWRGWHFIPLEVDNWTPSVAKEIKAVLTHLAKFFELRVFCKPDNIKLKRFSRIFGYTYDHTMDHPLHGYEVYILKRR